jgi:hypothetical protein
MPSRFHCRRRATWKLNEWAKWEIRRVTFVFRTVSAVTDSFKRHVVAKDGARRLHGGTTVRFAAAACTRGGRPHSATTTHTAARARARVCACACVNRSPLAVQRQLLPLQRRRSVESWCILGQTLTLVPYPRLATPTVCNSVRAPFIASRCVDARRRGTFSKFLTSFESLESSADLVRRQVAPLERATTDSGRTTSAYCCCCER